MSIYPPRTDLKQTSNFAINSPKVDQLSTASRGFMFYYFIKLNIIASALV